MSNREEQTRLISEIQEYFKGASARELHIFKSLVNASVRSTAAQSIGDREQHLTWTIANEAYQLILDEDLGAKEALIKAAQGHTQEVGAVLSEKSNPSKGLNKSIIVVNDNHPVQVEMVKKKKFHRQGIKNTSNVWQMLNLLSYFKEAYNEALDIENLKEASKVMKADMLVAKREIEDLQRTTGTHAMTDREKASILKREGYKQAEVGRILGVGKATVSRWWSSL